MRVIFFGTPSFAAEVLRFLLEKGVEIVAVVSKPDRPQGRAQVLMETPVKTAARLLCPSIPIYQPDSVSSPEFAHLLQRHKPDLFVVVAYGEILKQHLLDMPILGCINLHASLLPKYRGAAPIQRCLIEGVEESGVTIIQMVKKMDAGAMFEKVRVPVGPDMTFGELEQELCAVGKQALLKVIRLFMSGKPVGIEQDSTQVTFAAKIELEDCQIDWQQPAQAIHNLVRGANPYPGAWCFIQMRGVQKRLKIYRTRVVSLADLQKKEGKRLLVACGESALEILELQLEGKKRISSEEWLRSSIEFCF